MPKLDQLDRWQTELMLAEKFREKEFGVYRKDNVFKAGENLDYFDKGFPFSSFAEDIETTAGAGYGLRGVENFTTLNMFHSVVKNVVPSLYFHNPQINVVPLRKGDQEAAPLAREILNHYYKEIESEKVNKQVIWDAYVLGYGVYKIGYATEFGVDIVDEKDATKRRDRSLLEKVGLRKPKEEEVTHTEVEYNIINESPYIQYISPFDFLIDPRARSLNDAMWVAHCVRKTVESVKNNPKYKNTSKIKGLYQPDRPSDSHIQIPPSAIDSFKMVDLYEIHYRKDNNIFILVMSKDEGGIYREHYHEESPYQMDGWQFGMLTFNKHAHKLYPVSDLSKIKNLQDRITGTFDSILNQVDRFVPKIAVDGGKIGDAEYNTLKNGDTGAIVRVEGNPRDIINEVSFTQLKGDLLGVIDRMIDAITIETGVTKAKLLGVSVSETATGETLSRGGETLRLAEMTQFIEVYVNDQVDKLWQIIKQFAPFQELQLITGETGVDPKTNQTMYTWLPDIDSGMSERLTIGQFRFKMAVGSTERADMLTIRKQLENILNIIGNSEAVMLAQQQGSKIDIGSFLKMILRQYPDAVPDVNQIIQTITQETPGLVQPEGGPGGQTAGSGTNAMRALQAQPPQGMPQQMSEGSQI